MEKQRRAHSYAWYKKKVDRLSAAIEDQEAKAQEYSYEHGMNGVFAQMEGKMERLIGELERTRRAAHAVKLAEEAGKVPILIQKDTSYYKVYVVICHYCDRHFFMPLEFAEEHLFCPCCEHLINYGRMHRATAFANFEESELVNERGGIKRHNIEE